MAGGSSTQQQQRAAAREQSSSVLRRWCLCLAHIESLLMPNDVQRTQRVCSLVIISYGGTRISSVMANRET